MKKLHENPLIRLAHLLPMAGVLAIVGCADPGDELCAESFDDGDCVADEFDPNDMPEDDEAPRIGFPTLEGADGGDCGPPRHVPSVKVYTPPLLTSCNVPLNGQNRWLTNQQREDYCWMVKDGNGAKDTGSCSSPFAGQCAGYTFNCPAGYIRNYLHGNSGAWDCHKFVLPPCGPGEVRDGDLCVSDDPDCPIY